MAKQTGVKGKFFATILEEPLKAQCCVSSSGKLNLPEVGLGSLRESNLEVM